MQKFNIEVLNRDLAESLQKKIDNKTKPPGALGLLEWIALQAGLVQETLSPKLINPAILVFAGDHGVAGAGLVNPYPQEVTAQMVYNFVRGGAAINVFCRQQQIALTVVDAGVAHEFPPELPIIHAKIRKGTRNYTSEAAMTQEELEFAIAKGAALTDDCINTGTNIIGFGEMGIGNTSAAALVMHALTGYTVAECTGRGTGSNEAQLALKLKTLEQASAFHALPPGCGGAEVLRVFGGYEMAMMAGAMLRAAEKRLIILVDGFIATAALLAAQAICNLVLEYCLFCHVSEEKAHGKLLEYLGAKPILQLGMRLGEGTGCAMAYPLIAAAIAFMNEMASFDEAGVSGAES